MHIRRYFGLLTSIGLVAVLSGCPDTEGEFNDFYERCDSAEKCGSGSGGGSDHPCTPPTMASEVTGDYLFALSTKLAPKLPILFDTAVTATGDGAGAVSFTMTLQPLDRSDRQTPVGTPFEDLGPFDIAEDGSFGGKLPVLDLPGEANSLSGNPVSADVSIDGKMCTMELSCGKVSGIAILAGEIDLTGSDFTLDRLSAPGAFPDPPLINCAGDEAGPPP